MIKTLSKSIKEYKLPSFLAPLCVCLEVILEVIIPFVMSFLIDEGIKKQNIKVTVMWGAVMTVLAAISLLFGALSGRFSSVASAGFAKNLRRDMFYNVQNFSFSNIDKFSTAGIITRLTTDVNNLQMAYQMIIRVAVRCPFMLISAFIMAFKINASLSLIFLCVIPILGGGLLLISTRAHPIFERVFSTYDKLNRVVQENLRGIRVVKAYVREEHEKEKFAEVSKSIYSDFVKAERILAFNSPLMQFSIYFCMISLAWFGAKFVTGGTLTEGQLTSLFTYTMQMLMSLMMISMVFVMIVISKASAGRIVEILNETPEITSPQNPATIVKDGSVVFENVGFSYSGNKDKLCLKNANLKIESGETVGIIGGTGSSKTTLVQLISRIYDATEGSVTVGGINVKEYDLTTLRNAVAMVLQKNVLFSGTIKENMRWGDEHATDEEIINACKLACADEFINTFPDGYDTYIEQGGNNVSGGQRQRLCIARALLKKPKILILDDSTSAVDTKTDALIRRAFKEHIPGTTKIIIAQRVASVQDADKIVIMDNGVIDAVGTHDELLKTNKIYQEVYFSQVKGGDDIG